MFNAHSWFKHCLSIFIAIAFFCRKKRYDIPPKIYPFTSVLRFMSFYRTQKKEQFPKMFVTEHTKHIFFTFRNEGLNQLIAICLLKITWFVFFTHHNFLRLIMDKIIRYLFWILIYSLKNKEQKGCATTMCGTFSVSFETVKTVI